MVSNQWVVDSKQPTTNRQRLTAIWTYTRPEILQICRLLSEITILIPLIYWLSPWAQLWPPISLTLWLLVTMLIPLNLSRVMSMYRISSSWQGSILMGVGLLFVGLTVRLVLFQHYALFDPAWLAEFGRNLAVPDHPNSWRNLAIMLIAIIVWWRGISLIGRFTDIHELSLRFRLMSFVIVPAVIGFSAGHINWDISPYILLYLLASLLTIAITRAEQVEIGDTGAAFPITPSWLGRILLASCAIVIATGILSAMLAGDLDGDNLGVFQPIWWAIQFAFATSVAAFTYVSGPIWLAVEWFSNILVAIAEWFWSLIGFGEGQGSQFEGLDPTLPTQHDQLVGEEVLRWIGINHEILLTVVALLILALIIFLSYRAQVQAMAVRVVAMVLRADVGLADGGRPGRGFRDLINHWRQQRKANTIRRLYERLTYTAAKHGYQRGSTQTPNEYIATLNQAWPDHPEQIKKITYAYIQVRYGELPETRQEFDEIVQAWETLRNTTPTASG